MFSTKDHKRKRQDDEEESGRVTTKKPHLLPAYRHIFPTNTNEPILQKNPDRFILPWPPERKDVYALKLLGRASFWEAENNDLSIDEHDWTNKLNDKERFYIKNVLSFFAGADGVVLENLASRFVNEIQDPEIRGFFEAVQIPQEHVHQAAYSMMLSSYIKDPKERETLTKMSLLSPHVVRKNKWALEWASSNASFPQRLIAFYIVEGLFFSTSFCAIYWMKSRNLLPGLCLFNEWIARDEGLHCVFAALLYNLLLYKLPGRVIKEAFLEAVEIEKEFVTKSLPVSLIGMNAGDMCTYVEYIANLLLKGIGYKPLFPGVANPFPFMVNIGLEGKTNFFEKKVSEYQKLVMGDAADRDKAFTHPEEIDF